jgi:hypothetical protein
MSRGLGELQRKIIQKGEATKTIWERGIQLKFRVADDHAKSTCGVSVIEKNGWHWREDKKPWFEAEVSIDSAARLFELKAAFRSVDFVDFARADLDAALPACISLHHFRAVEWPHLWAPHIKPECRRDSRGRWMPQIPAEIARGRNAANAGLSRAVASMIERGLVYRGPVIKSNDSPAVIKRWRTHEFAEEERGEKYKTEYHTTLLVLSPIATASVRADFDSANKA